MRRRITRACTTVLLTGGFLFTAVGPAAAHDLDTNRFQVRARPVSGHYEDVGRRGPSVGDSFTFSDNLFHKGERVGRDDGSCDVTRFRRDRFAFQCLVTVTMTGRGQITTQGTFRFAFDERRPVRNSTLAVNGGTGQYQGASGTARFLPDEPRIRFRLS